MVAKVARASDSISLIGRAVPNTIAHAYSISSFSIDCFVFTGRCIVGTKYIRWSFYRALV